MGNLTIYKSYQKKKGRRRKEKRKSTAHFESHYGCPAQAQGCFFQGGRGKASSSGVPPLLPKCDLPTPPPQQGQLGPMTYISSPDFSKQISESCPTGMSSASSGVSELDVMSLKCHKHSWLAVSTQARSLAGVQQPSPEHMGSLSYHGCRDRARRPCVWGATGARLGWAGRRGVGGQ